MTHTENSPRNSQTVWEHLGELRSRILICFFAILAGAICAHFYHAEIISFLLKPAGTMDLVFLSPLDPLFFVMKIDLAVGLILAFPIISYVFLSYIRPVMHTSAWLTLVPAYLISLILILLGLLYAFLVIFPISIEFLLSIDVPGTKNIITANSYLSFLLTQSFISAILFQIPLIIIIGSYFNLVDIKAIAAKRRIVYLAVLILVSFITPTTDIFNLTIVMVPAILLFELGILFSRIILRVRAA